MVRSCYGFPQPLTQLAPNFIRYTLIKYGIVKDRNIKVHFRCGRRFEATPEVYASLLFNIKHGYEFVLKEGNLVVISEIGYFPIETCFTYEKFKPLDKEYRALNVKDVPVLDIGAYYGDSTLYFLKKGARMVYAYEPVKIFYWLLLKTLKINKVEDKVIANNYGLWFGDDRFGVAFEGDGTGLHVGSLPIKVRNITSEFSKIFIENGEFVVKMDCEGCEYSLLTVPKKLSNMAKSML
jgi:FkbM family methyltransferase